MTLTIPGLRLVSEANQREHWTRKAKRVKAQRTAVAVAWLASVPACFAPEFPLTVSITRIAPRALDTDNAVGSAKGARDSIADLLGVDDRDPRVVWVVNQRKGKPKEYAVEITLTPGVR